MPNYDVKFRKFSVQTCLNCFKKKSQLIITLHKKISVMVKTHDFDEISHSTDENSIRIFKLIKTLHLYLLSIKAKYLLIMKNGY